MAVWGLAENQSGSNSLICGIRLISTASILFCGPLISHILHLLSLLFPVCHTYTVDC